mmetsp:Transcript_155629/g.290475  ORF Transcript_155629/g.290475 Transcript_155629/m.290475 type:complete len:81 (+) Transcript_155629:15-257(+)
MSDFGGGRGWQGGVTKFMVSGQPSTVNITVKQILSNNVKQTSSHPTHSQCGQARPDALGHRAHELTRFYSADHWHCCCCY